MWSAASGGGGRRSTQGKAHKFAKSEVRAPAPAAGASGVPGVTPRTGPQGCSRDPAETRTLEAGPPLFPARVSQLGSLALHASAASERWVVRQTGGDHGDWAAREAGRVSFPLARCSGRPAPQVSHRTSHRLSASSRASPALKSCPLASPRLPAPPPPPALLGCPLEGGGG